MKKALLSMLFSLPLLFYANGQYVVNGTAISTGGNCFRLTPDDYNKGGSVWFQNKISLASDFTVDATVYLGNNDAGADGLAFVLQPVCSGLGGIGGGLGYQGISPSLAVELDTWQNTDRGDPAQDHIGLMANGHINHINANANTLQGYNTLFNIENDANHSLRIVWDAAAKNLKVYFNGTLQINYTADIVANIFGGNRNVFWGFTAATGAAKNEHRVCINSSNFTEEGSFTVTKPSCPSYNNGAIDLDPAGGIGPFEYLWSNGATSEDLTGISAGNYTVTVTDRNNCKSVFTIPVVNELDETPPVIICPADVTINNTPGLCTGTTTLAKPTVTDNCTTVIDGVEMVANGNFDLQAAGWNACGNIVEAFGTELNYGGSNGSNRVAEIDHQPVTLCQSISGFVVGQMYQLSFRASRRVGAPATVGTIVTINGGALSKIVNRSNTTFSLTPEAFTFVATQTTHTLTFVPTAGWSGTLGIIVDDISIKNGTITNNAPATYPIGNTLVTWTATDLNGNTATCTQKVTVVDNEPPIITCPAAISVSNDPGECGAIVNYPAITATDNCTNCSAPVSIPGYNYYGSFGGHTYFTSIAAVSWPEAKAAAEAAGGHLATITSAAENAFLSNNTLYWIGLTDEVTEGTFTWVTGEPLTFTAWGPGEPNNAGNEDWVEINRNGPGLWNDMPVGYPRQFYLEFDCMTILQTAGLPSGSLFPVGTTTNTFVVTDASGNTSTCSFDVTVTDGEAPLAACKPATVTLAGGVASITVDNINDGSDDNCGIKSIIASQLSFDCSNIGDNNVTLTVTDDAGNESTCTAIVTVVGEIPNCTITSVPSSNTYTGGVPTTLYLGYGAQSTTLQVNAPASGAPYTYAWTGGTLSNYNTADPEFTATTAGTFTFTVEVTNKYGCSTTCSITICVMDIRVPGTNGKKVYVCHIPPGNPGNPQTLSISVNAVPAHVGLHGGDKLGTCDMECDNTPSVSRRSAVVIEDIHSGLHVTVAPNPTSSHFTFRLHSEDETPVTIRIMNGTGQVLESANKVHANGTVEMGSKLMNGMYFAEFLQGTERQVIKVMKIGSR